MIFSIDAMEYNRVFPYLNLQPLSLEDNYKSELDRNGIVLISVPTYFSNQEFLNVISKLGDPIEESAAVESKYIEDRFILNIKSDIGENITVENEPFSIHGLRMHVEKAFSEQEKQPNYIALLCITRPQEENGGQTIVRAMTDLTSQYTVKELETMKTLYPMSLNGDIISKNPIYALDKSRKLQYLSYRDLGRYGEDWVFKHSNMNGNLIITIVSKLEKYLYSPQHIRALKWQPGYLYIFDNKKNFHARTEQKNTNKRHLKRIRVV